ncbi:hypothetical protein BKA82DRAFT_4122563 [Pisolithus tinctorius]|nr:hypothetical protein BKA82DRAFT_4122563 [Pisolithus tinctorius]
MHYPEDAAIMKLIVTAVWTLDTLHSLFVCDVLYYYLVKLLRLPLLLIMLNALQVTNYGVPTSLGYSVWSLPASILANAFLVFVVQLFFTHKIYHLCRPNMKWLVTAPILRQILLVLAHFGGFEIGVAILMFLSNDLSTVSSLTSPVVIPFGILFILSEGLITVSLCILLYDGSRSVTPRTKRLVNTLMIYAVNRCLLTLLVAIAELVTCVYLPQDSWTMGLDFIFAKLYANSLLASLNSRKYLRNKDSVISDPRISTIRFVNLPKVPDSGGDGESPKD